jgi:peptidyl-prolyl cis-trans isomerase D
MATLERLRKRSGLLLAIVVGMALFAFVLGDLFRSGGSMFQSSRRDVAEIHGEHISIDEYQKRVDNLTQFYKQQRRTTSLNNETTYQIRDQVWEQMVREFVLLNEYEELGIMVTDEELFELVQGRNPHPIVQDYFTDPQTGQFRRQDLLRFISQLDADMDPRQKNLWLYLEEQIVRQQRISKFFNLISKGIYITNYEAKQQFEENQKAVDAQYVVQKYESIEDSEVDVTTSDLKDYYEKHKKLYEQDDEISLKYIVMNIQPSREDDSITKAWIYEIAEEFKEVKDVKQYVNLNSDTAFDPRYYQKEELPDTMADFMFSEDTGAVFGPYYEDGAYKVAKLKDIKYLPDSVRARQILLPVNQNVNPQVVKETADSLVEQIKKGADFARLARENSQDPQTAVKGGDMGWFTREEQFPAIVDSTFFTDVGDVKLVPTRVGYHIVEVTEQSPLKKRVQVGMIENEVEYSEETYQEMYAKAHKFAGENNTLNEFLEAANEKGYTVQQAQKVDPNQRSIPNVKNARPVIRWAYDANENDVSKAFEIKDKFVIAALIDKQKEGIAPFEQVKEDIRPKVMNQKKAEKIITQFNNVSSNEPQEIAKALDLETKEAKSLRFFSYTMPGEGLEPKVVGGIASLEENEISIPLEGRSGVYVAKATTVIMPQFPDSFLNQKKTMMQMIQGNAGPGAYEALKENADIQDNRAKFY